MGAVAFQRQLLHGRAEATAWESASGRSSVGAEDRYEASRFWTGWTLRPEQHRSIIARTASAEWKP